MSQGPAQSPFDSSTMDTSSLEALRNLDSSQTSSVTTTTQLTQENLRLHNTQRLTQDQATINTMSQDQELPILRPASYQRPATPENNNNKTAGSQQPAELATPPKTIRSSSSNKSLNAASVSMVVTSDVSLTAEDIRKMSDELSQARQNNEFPRTTSSPMNPQIVVEDYGFLKRLREERGDHSQPPSESYMCLRVEVTRRIQERDSQLDENEVKLEAARRVTNYINNLEHEQFIYNSVTSAPSTPSVQGSSSSHVDAETFSEEVLSIIEQVADQTLLDATEPLRHHEKVMRILDKCLREDGFALKDRIQVLTGQNDAYAHLLRKLEDAHQKQTNALQLHEEALKEHDANLAEHDANLTRISDTLSNAGSFYNAQNAEHNQNNTASAQLLEQHQNMISALQTFVQSQDLSSIESQAAMTNIINQLNAFATALPGAIQQGVNMSLAQNLPVAIQMVLQAQREAMLAINQEAARRPEIDNDLLTRLVDEQLEALRANEAKTKRARFFKAMEKLFCA